MAFSFSFLLLAQEQKLGHEIYENGTGADKQRFYFENLHYPHKMLSADQNLQIWKILNQMPSDLQEINRGTTAFNKWEHLGPYGVSTNNGYYSGRVRFLEIDQNGTLRAGSASGGIWEYNIAPGNITNRAIADKINSEWIGAFATHPNNPLVMFVGTGEPSSHSGTGLWKTINGGWSWKPVSMGTTTPNGFFTLKFNPLNSDNIHAATTDGHFYSTDGGQTWTRTLSGRISDLEINPQNPDILYAVRWGNRFYKSTNAGQTWTVLTGAPLANVGRTSLAICPSNPNIIYANIAKNSDNTSLGIYKSNDAGTTWGACQIGTTLGGGTTNNILGNQGWYDNIIEVSPINCNLVLAGGVGMWRTTNGFRFDEVNAVHADQHAIEFAPDGSVIYIGNDGGVYYSTNNGQIFRSSDLNTLPVTQYYTLAKSKMSNIAIGGTQDNGVSYGSKGIFTLARGGDGGGVAISPVNPNRMYASVGVYGGALAFRRHTSHNGGTNWTDSDTGVDSCRQWFVRMRTNDRNPIIAYSQCGPTAYFTTDLGNSWNKLNSSPFGSDIRELMVSRGKQPNIFVCLSANSGTKVMVYEESNATWYNRTTGLPNGTYVRKITPHPIDSNIAFAIMGGMPSNGTGIKLYKTNNRGITWRNITGNLPNLPLTDVIAHPTDSNLLYLGSEFGAFKSIDGGQNWERWVSGFPGNVQITEMDYADSLAVNGNFWVYVSTYGRGIWKREVSGDDAPVGISELDAWQNAGFRLYPNIPNPFENQTLITFEIKNPGNVQLNIYNALGKKVANMLNQNMPAGKHQLNFEKGELAAGIYFCELNYNGKTVSNKLIIR